MLADKKENKDKITYLLKDKSVWTSLTVLLTLISWNTDNTVHWLDVLMLLFKRPIRSAISDLVLCVVSEKRINWSSEVTDIKLLLLSEITSVENIEKNVNFLI